MARLVKIGDYYINPAFVKAVWWHDGTHILIGDSDYAAFVVRLEVDTVLSLLGFKKSRGGKA